MINRAIRDLATAIYNETGEPADGQLTLTVSRRVADALQRELTDAHTQRDVKVLLPSGVSMTIDGVPIVVEPPKLTAEMVDFLLAPEDDTAQ